MKKISELTTEERKQLNKYVGLSNKEREQIILQKIKEYFAREPEQYQVKYDFLTIRVIRWRLFGVDLNNSTWCWRESDSKVRYSCNQLVKKGLLDRVLKPSNVYGYFLPEDRTKLATIYSWIKESEE